MCTLSVKKWTVNGILLQGERLNISYRYLADESEGRGDKEETEQGAPEFRLELILVADTFNSADNITNSFCILWVLPRPLKIQTGALAWKSIDTHDHLPESKEAVRLEVNDGSSSKCTACRS